MPASKTLDHVIVYTLQDNWQSPSPPTDTRTFTQYGIIDFSVHGWDGTQWVTLGSVTGNNLVKRTVSFSAFTTNKIRVNKGAGSSGDERAAPHFPDRPLPRDEHGRPVPDPEADGPYSQLGQRDGRTGKYDQAREFDAEGKPVRDLDFTDHGRPNVHENPHQHSYGPNSTGGTPQRGDSEPLP